MEGAQNVTFIQLLKQPVHGFVTTYSTNQNAPNHLPLAIYIDVSKISLSASSSQHGDFRTSTSTFHFHEF